jgi:hypothetical protein
MMCVQTYHWWRFGQTGPDGKWAAASPLDCLSMLNVVLPDQAQRAWGVHEHHSS